VLHRNWERNTPSTPADEATAATRSGDLALGWGTRGDIPSLEEGQHHWTRCFYHTIKEGKTASARTVQDGEKLSLLQPTEVSQPARSCALLCNTWCYPCRPEGSVQADRRAQRGHFMGPEGATRRVGECFRDVVFARLDVAVRQAGLTCVFDLLRRLDTPHTRRHDDRLYQARSTTASPRRRMRGGQAVAWINGVPDTIEKNLTWLKPVEV